MIKNEIKNMLPTAVLFLIREINKFLVYYVKVPVFEYATSSGYIKGRYNQYLFFLPYIKGAKCIEIGGPTPLFRSRFPVYRDIKYLDEVNYSDLTFWRESVFHRNQYGLFGCIVENKYVAEATDLTIIESERYDLLISSNCLEHVANPIKALFEFKRLVRKGGHILIILPNKNFNFDRRRSITTFEHIKDDYEKSTGEDDLTHLPEILENHDLTLDGGVGTREEFEERSMQNFKNRCLHHHVFDRDLVAQIFRFVGVSAILDYEIQSDYYFLGRRD